MTDFCPKPAVTGPRLQLAGGPGFGFWGWGRRLLLWRASACFSAFLSFFFVHMCQTPLFWCWLVTLLVLFCGTCFNSSTESGRKHVLFAAGSLDWVRVCCLVQVGLKRSRVFRVVIFRHQARSFCLGAKRELAARPRGRKQPKA